jgi:PEP-CTERM motif
VKRLVVVVFAMIIVLGMVSVPAVAGSLCVNTTDCTLELNQGNSSSGFGSGNFGTVQLVGNGIDSVTITVSLLDGWDIIKAGFPASFGFTDSLAGTPVIDGFSSALYSGLLADSSSDLHFDGFGYFGDGAATTGPHNGAGLQTVSFTVTQAGLGNVNDLLNLSRAPAGDGQAYFVVDVGQMGGNTGLLGVTGAPASVPEPGSCALLLAGLGVLGLALGRRKGRTI